MTPYQLEQLLEKAPAWVRVAVERAYRRGVAQGGHFCVQAMREGQTLDELEAWLERTVIWRYNQQGGKKILPPEPWMFARQKGVK